MNTKKLLCGLLAVVLVLGAAFTFAMPASAAETAKVAKIGDTEYATLEEAIKSAPKGTPTTITLQKDYTIKSTMVGHQNVQNITINLNGYTLSSSGIALTSYRKGSTLTIQNGTVKGNSSSGTLRATYGGHIILGDNLTIQGAGGGATLVYVDNGSVEIAAKNGVKFVGGKLDFNQSTNVNNKLNVAASVDRTYFGTLADAVAAAKAGDTVTMMADASASNILVIDKAITLDGNGKTLTSTAGRAINVSGADGVTIKNLTIKASGERAVNIIQNATNVTLDNVNATAANYTVNVASSAPNAVVAIKNSTLNGLCTVNVAGAGAKVTVDGSTINCNDNNTTAGEAYAALCLNKDATNGKITVIGSTINVTEGSDSEVARNSAIGGEITIDGSTDQVSTVVAVITYPGSDNYYGFYTLESAIEFAKAGDTITLLRDVTVSEIIVIDKAITLDGNGKTLTSTATRAINVNTNGEVTIKNLTIKASGERAINVIQKPATLTLDNVTATAANYTLNLAKSAGAAKVAVVGSNLTGLCTVNVAAPGAEVTINNTTIVCNDQNSTVGESYAALELNKDATGAKITATGCTITVAENSDSVVARNHAENGIITIDASEAEVSKAVAFIQYGDYYYAYETLAAAIAAAKDGDTITLLNDISVDADDMVGLDGYHTFFKVEGKSITIDLNGKTVYADASAVTDKFVVGVFSTNDGGHLTLKDSVGTGAVTGYSGESKEAAWLNSEKGNWDYNYKFYSLIVNYEDGCTITINGGNYILDYAGDSLMYTAANEGIVVNGGTFTLGNLGGIRNGMPWVFNARGQNIRHVVVNGGSFCADIQHQYYPFEVLVPKTLALKNENGMYTVVDAVAYVTEREWSSAWYTNEVGYATLEEAIAACEGPKTRSKKTSEQEVVVLLKDITLAANTTIEISKPVVIDLNGKTIYGENTRTNTHNFLIDVKGGTLTASNGTIAMKHTGTNMGWNGATTVIDVTAGGVLNLNGVTVQNQGGTDMNFAVHMNNWGEVTLNADNCVFDATYCGVRVFNSGYDMNNVKITNSKLTGATRAFWVHNYIGDLDSSKHSDEAIKARLNLDIYGNNNTFEITGTAKSPIRYGFGNTVYFNAEGSQVVDSAEELQDAINNGSSDITLGGDIDLSEGITIP